MAGTSPAQVIHYLASHEHGCATQIEISEALGLSQGNISKILRYTPGIIPNTRSRPTLYSFDATATVKAMAPVGNNSGNYTGVTRPDGSILLDGRWYSPQPDTLSDKPVSEITTRMVNSCKTIAELPFPVSAKNWEQIASFFDDYALTIRARLARGDFNESA